jgi:hypothetical protein
MKKSNRGATTPVATDVVAAADAAESPTNGRNGSSALVDESTPEQASGDLSAILASLQTMRNGDFSVRLPGSWVGLPGKIADTFNSIVAANQQMAD